MATEKIPIRKLLLNWRNGKEYGFRGLTEKGVALLQNDFDRPIIWYRGKVRDVLASKSHIIMLHSDSLSAFDRFIGLVPFKGLMLSELSQTLFQELAPIVPNHFVRRLSGRALLVENLEPLKIEVVVRGYLAGSMMRAYQEGSRDFYGIELPEGLVDFGKLPTPLITPTTKAPAFEHDVPVAPKALIGAGLCTRHEWDMVSQLALKIYAWGVERSAKAGYILADTKYEFGRTETGEIKLIDEIHTPDSSRYWKMDSYEARMQSKQPPEMMDKENVRRYLMKCGFSGSGPVPPVDKAHLYDLAITYLDIIEKLIGNPLAVNADEIHNPLIGLTFS